MRVSEWHMDTAADQAGYRIHRIAARGEWAYPEHTHRGFCELVCATRGRFRHVINGRLRMHEAGETILIRAGDRHRLDGRGFTYVNVMFQPDWLIRLDAYVQGGGRVAGLLTAPDAPVACVPAGRRREWESALDRLLAQPASARGRGLFVRFLLDSMIEGLAPLAAAPGPPEMPEWLRDAIQWADRAGAPVPSVRDMARRCCRCHEHVTRVFRRHFQTTPAAYLAGLRVDRAAAMLVTTNAKLSEVARATGFENEGYFYRRFRRRHGMTPLAYRRAFGPRSIQA